MGSSDCSDSAESDSNLRCFFCCSGRHTDLECTNKSSLIQLSFRNIFRYLHLLIPPYLDDDGDGKVNKFNDLVERLGVCEQCTQLAVEFNELYHILEVTKLRLDWCLRKLRDMMTKAKNEAQSISAEVNENGNFRGDLIGRLNQMTTVPRVALYKTKVPLCKSEIRQLHLPEEPIPSPACHSDAEEWNGEFDENNTMDCPTAPKTPEPVAAVTEVEVPMKMEINIDKAENLRRQKTHHSPKPIRIKIKRKTPLKYLKCSFCRAQFKKTSCNAEDSLHRHVAHYHCDQLFPNHKVDSVTEIEFQRIVGLHLFQDLINEKEDTFCVYCNKRFASSTADWTRVPLVQYVSQIKGHLIQAHYENLEEKLLSFQRNPDLHKILSDRASIGEDMCECGVYLQNHLSRVTHDKWHCPLTARIELKRGRKPNQKTSDQSILSNFVPASSSASSKLTCKSCKKSFSTNGHAVRHWKYYCTEGERLPTPKGDSLSCDYCSYQCPNRMHNGKSLMKTHLVRLHPEHYFKNEMEMDSVSEWKREHFGKIVTQVLFPKFDSGDGIKFVSCSLCTAEYKKGHHNRNLVYLRKHLINNHKHELRERLKVILKDSDESLKNLLKSSRVPGRRIRGKSRSKIDSDSKRKITVKVEDDRKRKLELEFISEVKAGESDISESNEVYPK